MQILGIDLNLITTVAMVLTFIEISGTNAESSGGFRGKLTEKIGKSRHRMIHTIELKTVGQSQITAFPYLRDPIIMNRRPGEQILQNDTDVTVTCLRGWKEPDCLTCAQGWKEPDCLTCAQGWKEPACQTCAHGWTGDNCDTCALNFGPPGQCNSCVTGWTGDDCSECATNFGPAGQCDQCLRGWTGDNCSECAVNFGPAGQCDGCLGRWAGHNCDTCPTGWTGENCDMCEFGFNTTSNCTKCIQNGYWRGFWAVRYVMIVYLTLEGPACSNLVPGTTVEYNLFSGTVTGGSYNATTSILTVTDNNDPHGSANPVGWVNITDKSITGNLTGAPGSNQFTVHYRG